MNIIGIITEYNPFHNGHAYQINELKEKENADFVVVAMSGDYVQRGGPAIFDKFARTTMALQGGADLVIMLPTSISLASAEQFARGGVSILSSLGVDGIAYGCEEPNLHQLKGFASFFHAEPQAYRDCLSIYLKKGLTYPAARQAAFDEYQLSFASPKTILSTGFQSQQPDSHFLASPNNILGIEYEKALLHLKRQLKTIPLQRKGSSYHSNFLDHELASATAIRKALFHHDLAVSNYIPDSSFQQLLTELTLSGPLNENHFSTILEYELYRHKNSGYTSFLDCNSDCSNRIQNLLPQFTTFSDFATLVKTRGYTHTRIQRILMHILCNITTNDHQMLADLNYAPYARVLGFRKDSSEILGVLQKKSSIPIITSVADGAKELEDSRLHFFNQDLAASDLYHLIVKQQFGRSIANDFSHPLSILSPTI